MNQVRVAGFIAALMFAIYEIASGATAKSCTAP